MSGKLNNKAFNRQGGQGMSEYIIVVALVALAAITVVSMFGGTVQAQFSNMAAALAGDDDKSEAATVTVDKQGDNMDDFFDKSSSGTTTP